MEVAVDLSIVITHFGMLHAGTEIFGADRRMEIMHISKDLAIQLVVDSYTEQYILNDRGYLDRSQISE
jgi:hypothetical protein